MKKITNNIPTYGNHIDKFEKDIREDKGNLGLTIILLLFAVALLFTSVFSNYFQSIKCN